MTSQVPRYGTAAEQRARGRRGNGAQRPPRTVSRGASVRPTRPGCGGHGEVRGEADRRRAGGASWVSLAGASRLAGEPHCTWHRRRWAPCWASLQNSARGSVARSQAWWMTTLRPWRGTGGPRVARSLEWALRGSLTLGGRTGAPHASLEARLLPTSQHRVHVSAGGRGHPAAGNSGTRGGDGCPLPPDPPGDRTAVAVWGETGA